LIISFLATVDIDIMKRGLTMQHYVPVSRHSLDFHQLHVISPNTTAVYVVDLLDPLAYFLPKTFKLVFQPFDYECTRWRLFQKCVVQIKVDIHVFIVLIIMNNTMCHW